MKHLRIIDADALFEEIRAAETEQHFETYSESAEGIGKGERIRGQRLGSAQRPTALRVRKGKVLTTDGPFAETKEQLRLS